MTTPSPATSSPAEPPSRIERISSPVAGVVLLLFLLATFSSTLFAVWRGSLDLFPQGISQQAFLEGHTTQGVADALANAPMPKEGARLEREFSWLTAGDLGPRVRQGCPGWLFLADELTVYPHAADNARARVAEVAAVSQALAKRHIALMVVVVPDKTRLEADRLCGLHRATVMRPRLDDWTQGLTAAGIPWVNVSPALTALPQTEDGTTAFLRTDTHWNEQGAAAAASLVAQRIAATGLSATPRVDYEVLSKRATRPGDLVRLAGLEALPLKLQPASEVAQSSTFTALATNTEAAAGASAPAATDAADDLFGDANLPNIALVGTSFSRTSNFVPFLERDLHTRIGNFAKDGGDFTGAARAYFAGPAWKETPPKLLIWEIPERVLEAPLDPKPIWPAATPAAAKRATP
jgi:alginate O-acetyltransferase complex protein AlgJ